jgi:hypothetical protein
MALRARRMRGSGVMPTRNGPGAGTTFIVPGDTADVRAVSELIMTIAADRDGPTRWLVRGTDARIWALVRSSAHPDIPYEGRLAVDRD